MGMYTELAINVTFKGDTPAGVIAILQKMVEAKDKFEPGYEHPLFQTDRWHWMLNSGGSCYFDGLCSVKLEKDDLFKKYSLLVWTNIKNYSSEWEHFLNWIAPHIDNDLGYIGHIRYEESFAPDMLFIKDGKIVRVHIDIQHPCFKEITG